MVYCRLHLCVGTFACYARAGSGSCAAAVRFVGVYIGLHSLLMLKYVPWSKCLSWSALKESLQVGSSPLLSHTRTVSLMYLAAT